MSHSHTGTASGTTGSESSHTHGDGSFQVGFQGGRATISGSGGYTGASSSIGVTGTSGSGSSHSHSFSDGFTTSGASNSENRPPYYNVVFIIRTK